MRRATQGLQTTTAGFAPLRLPAARPGQRRGVSTSPRRDPRRFGQGVARNLEMEPAVASPSLGASDNVRLFAHTFGAAFLFVTVFLA